MEHQRAVACDERKVASMTILTLKIIKRRKREKKVVVVVIVVTVAAEVTP